MAITIRHIKRDPSGSTTVLDELFSASSSGVNDAYSGFQGGMYETRVYEEGQFNLLLPNLVAADSVRHLDRFGITSPDTLPFQRLYNPGDEWVEIYDNSELLYVGTPVTATVSRASITLGGFDALWQLRKVYEYYAGYWNHAPRDVWEHYCNVWKVYLSEDFQSVLIQAEFPSSVSSTTTTTSDGRFRFRYARQAAGGTIRIAPGVAADVGRLQGGVPSEFTIGTESEQPHQGWQVKINFTRNRFGKEWTAPYGDNAYIRVGIHDISANSDLAYIQIQEVLTNVVAPDHAGAPQTVAALIVSNPGIAEVIVEGRDRWIYFFYDQALVGCMPTPLGSTTVVPFVSLRTGDTTSTQWMDIDSFLFRRTKPFLMRDSARKGDYHLPGVAPAGGLHAFYYDDSGIHNASDYSSQVFNPLSQDQRLFRERRDTTLNFDSSVERWQPLGTTTALWWSVRWTGSVYLDLFDHDYRLQYDTAQEGARLWLGKTRIGEQLLDNWYTGLGTTQTSGSLRSHIGVDPDTGGYHNGWYPILIEYGQRGTPGSAFVLRWSQSGGSFTVIPKNKLSPYGIYNDQIRSTSHYDVIRSLSETYGYQMSVSPRALESGSFPGVLEPKRHVGRDSNKVITEADVADFQTQIDATENANASLGDGSGLATTESNVQLTVEAIDYESAESALMLLSAYESFGDIGYAPLLQQRMDSYLALRSSAWENVTATPSGNRELTDTLPLTGDIAMLEWKAGDGVRLHFPSIGVVDGSTDRQMLGVQRTFQPVALGGVSVSFRQRPRGLREFIRQMQRRVLVKHKNYQGQITRWTGTAGAGPTYTADTTGLANRSRIPLPPNLANVAKATIHLMEKPDGDVQWFIWVNGAHTNLPAVTQPGTYDVTPNVDYARDTSGNSLPYMEVSFKLTRT